MEASTKDMSAARRMQRAPAVAWQRLGEAVVVLDISRRRLVGLDGTASALWETLATERGLDESVLAVAEKLQQPASAPLREAVISIAEELRQRQLLLVTPEPSAGATSNETLDEDSPLVPGIAWEERLEDAGVYAACGKDPFGELGGTCPNNPYALTS